MLAVLEFSFTKNTFLKITWFWGSSQSLGIKLAKSSTEIVIMNMKHIALPQKASHIRIKME